MDPMGKVFFVFFGIPRFFGGGNDDWQFDLHTCIFLNMA